MSLTPLHRFLRGELPALRVEPDGRQRGTAARPAAVLAGSFNPLHAGHLGLAGAAAAVLGTPVDFELCICNADKPPLAEAEVAPPCRPSRRWPSTPVEPRS